jgi:putative transposase
MATENAWGASRVHGELQMLGFDVSERTVSRYLRGLRRRPEARQSWLTFLRNHRELAATMDPFVVCTATFRLPCVLFVIRHGRRQIVHCNVTEHPTAAWVVQQIREAFPYETAPRYFIFDRDSIFSAAVVGAVKAVGAKPTRTAYRSPWQNGTAERWIGCARAELLDRVIILGERHLLRLLREHVRWHHDDRTHLGLEKDTPMQRAVERRPSPTAKVVALPRAGGLHHRYAWREAAWLAPAPQVRHLVTTRDEMMAVGSAPGFRVFPRPAPALTTNANRRPTTSPSAAVPDDPGSDGALAKETYSASRRSAADGLASSPGRMT